MVQRFEAKLSQNGIEYEKSPNRSQQSNDSTNSSKPPKKSKKYIPTYRSGAYAILLALLDGDNDLMSKSEIIKHGQNYCDSSFTIPESNRSQYAYTAWNSIKILIQKDLVIKKGTKYALSETGQVLAQELPGHCDENNSSDLPAQEYSLDIDSQNKNIPRLQTLSKGNYTIYLILDNREIRGRTDRSYLSEELEKLGINLMTRSLDLGDFLWIARDNQTGVELVLDYLVERKTMADLVYYIKDGRFKEQKYRQRNSGIRNVMYLIEDTHIQEAKNFGWPRIQSAIVSIQVRDGFFVKRVENIQGVINYLASVTRTLIEMNQDNDLIGENSLSKSAMSDFISGNHLMTWDTFSKVNSKSKGMTLRDLWTRQLLTIKGMSMERASRIVKKYPSCSHLMESIDELCDPIFETQAGKRLIELLTSSSFGH